MANENGFADWLHAALDGRPNVYLVKNSGEKENGRPRIDDSRVSKWLKGDQRPSVELAILAAKILERPAQEALAAAGYESVGASIEAGWSYTATVESRMPDDADQSPPARGSAAGTYGWDGTAKGHAPDLADVDTEDLLQEVARRMGAPESARRREHEEREQTAPDPEGPEHGA